MKKVLGILTLGLILVALTSCQKYYTCECTDVYNGGTPNTYEAESIFKTKKNAKSRCQEIENEIMTKKFPDGHATVDCNLK